LIQYERISPLPSLDIRQVIEADLDACYHIEINAFPPAEAAAKETIRTRIRVFPEGFLVGQLDGKLVGMINSGATDRDDFVDEAFKGMEGHDSEGANIVVFSLSVLPDYQRRGFARQLMNAFIERSRELGKKKILLICKSELIAYYESIGFAYLKESTSTHGGAAWHEMGLSL
jgi:ribosomal protein S18 acetylase RimI-like enzyme